MTVYTNTNKVSVITPAYNSAEYLPQTLASVQRQSYENWEMLICDDGSNDATLDIIADTMKADRRIRLVGRTDRLGPAVARNEAIKAAVGRYIAFLDSDDLWVEDKLVRQVAFMEESTCVLSYTGFQQIDATGKKLGRPVNVPLMVTYEQLLRTPIIACLTAMYDAERLGKVYMPAIRKRQDFGLWLKILRNGCVARGLNESLAHYRIRPGSVSSNKFSAALYVWKTYRDVEDLSLLKSIHSFLGYAVCSLRKVAKRW